MRVRPFLWLLPLVVVVIAGGLRFFDLSTPNFKVYDEFFYARDACTYVAEGQFFCGMLEDSWVHPPVAKWMIAAGIWAFAPTALGARAVAALIGTLSVVTLFLLAKNVLRSTWAGAGAALLLAVDPLHLVNSRAAMLDTFAGFFVLVSLLTYVYDRAAQDRTLPDEEEAPKEALFKRNVDLSSFKSRWLLVCGIASGLGIGSKWTVGPVLAGIIFVVVWDARNRALSTGTPRPLRAGLKSQAARIAICLVLVPLLVYGFSFVGRLYGRFTVPPWDDQAWARRVVQRQVEMAGYHLELREQYPEEIFFQASPAWSWPLIKRPIPYSFMIRDGQYHHLLATGNPVVWWPALGAMLALAVVHWRRRSEHLMARIMLVGFGGTYLYWLLAGIGATQIYINYFVPAVPFLCLAVAWAWTKTYRGVVGRGFTLLHAASSVALFVFLLPVLLFRPLSPEAWERRMLFSDCRPHLIGDKTVAAGFKFESDDLRVSFVPSFLEGEEPPADSMLPMLAEADGWCWR